MLIIFLFLVVLRGDYMGGADAGEASLLRRGGS